jgi:hypothetical protein
MTTALVLALIALAGSLFSTLVTTFGLPAHLARRDARKVLDTYREPLIAASYELQARLYNILCNTFVDKYIRSEDEGRRNAAIESTLYVFAQFFGWKEVIRQDVQYLRFARDQQTRRFAQLLQDIGETFLSDSYGPQFMIWRVEQRGLGERMIASTNGAQACLGYASFLDKRGTMAEWLEPIERDLDNIGDGGRRRLTKIQNLLYELVTELDENQTRYPFEIKRA